MVLWCCGAYPRLRVRGGFLAPVEGCSVVCFFGRPAQHILLHQYHVGLAGICVDCIQRRGRGSG